jgi:ABC-type transporter Mla subunit MlaD
MSPEETATLNGLAAISHQLGQMDSKLNAVYRNVDDLASSHKELRREVVRQGSALATMATTCIGRRETCAEKFDDIREGIAGLSDDIHGVEEVSQVYHIEQIASNAKWGLLLKIGGALIAIAGAVAGYVQFLK